MNEYDDSLLEMEMNYLLEQGFVSNFDNKYQEALRRTIQLTGVSMRIASGVVGVKIMPDCGMVSLWKLDSSSIPSDFWDTFDRLKKESKP